MATKPIVMSLINDAGADVLDNLHKVLKHYKDKKEADRVLKYIIKISLKVSILRMNDQFSQQEINFLDQFTVQLQEVGTSFISFYQNKSSYDKHFLQNTLEECRILAQTIIERHLTSKSKNGVDLVFRTLSEDGLLDAMFTNETYKDHMDKAVEGDVTEMSRSQRRGIAVASSAATNMENNE